jgi:hemolysin activation/secretion protein
VAGPSFVLRRIELEGNRAVPTSEVEPIWVHLLGTPVDVATLEDVAARLSAAYRARGFVLSQVVLPAQTIADGVVRFVAIEGFIDHLEVQGGSPSAQRAAGVLFAPTAAERPLRLQTLERSVLLSRDILGGQVETALAPSSGTFGAADLIATLTPQPFQGFVSVDNRAGRLLGPWTVRVGGSLYGQLGLNERIDLQVAATPDGQQLRFGQALVALPLMGSSWPWDGTVLEVGGDVTRAEPILARAGLSDFTTVTDENQFRAVLVVPLIRTRPENLYARLGFTWRDVTSESVFAGVNLGESIDNLRVATFRLSWDFVDRLDGVMLFDGGFRKGIDALGATIGQSGLAAPNPDFLLLFGYVSRLQALGQGPWSVFSEAIAQWTDDPLPSSERFAVGGPLFGRGYAPGNTTGDSGFGGRLELRRSFIDMIPETLPLALQAYVFGDWGAAIDRSIYRDGQQWETLASMGAGVRMDITQRVSINPEIAFHIAGRPADTARGERGARFLIGAVVRW